ncbi:MAG: molecular chaperone [Spirochaetales bacterium]|nr:molecular chaperone [Spirochaetales bacterium]
MRHILKRLAMIFAVLMLLASPVFAFQFEPLTQTFAVSGAEATRTYTITNDSDEVIAVTVSALTRDQDGSGAEVNQDASRYFSIQPAKILIQPQSAQIVRVQYRGPKTVTTELSFRIKAEQVPYSQGRSSTNKSMFNFLYIYNASAYVKPAKVTENVIVSKVMESSDNLALTLTNAGTVHQLLNEAKITIQDASGKVVTLTGTEMLPEIYGTNILARKTWTKTVPWPEGLSRGSSYKATIEYNYSAE